MSFCVIYSVVFENRSAQNSPGGGKGVYKQLTVYINLADTVQDNGLFRLFNFK